MVEIIFKLCCLAVVVSCAVFIVSCAAFAVIRLWSLLKDELGRD